MSTALPRNPENTTAVLAVTGYRVTRRAWVAAAPGRAYDLLSTMSNIDRWSPDAIRSQYEEGAGTWAGARFRGRNQRGAQSGTAVRRCRRSCAGSSSRTPGDVTVGSMEGSLVALARWIFDNPAV
ncbi:MULTISPECIES: hypothetical protein [Streptomyces]|uniref:Polyketide cyclase n=1 Tax=Streptomyces silvae TaxID=2803812 RepID=A0ABU8A901_9ACTN|nr:hypothetical protein [Streptomyces sp. ME02-6979-3A]MDX3325599.1 hypothetical protein [Streptomyces sp. ME02-6979-3A]